MTDSTKQPLVQRMARAIAASIYRSEGLESMNYAGIADYCDREWHHYTAEAQVALDACHADQRDAIDRIRHLLPLCRPAHVAHQIESLVDKLDGKPSGGAV